MKTPLSKRKGSPFPPSSIPSKAASHQSPGLRPLRPGEHTGPGRGSWGEAGTFRKGVSVLLPQKPIYAETAFK